MCAEDALAAVVFTIHMRTVPHPWTPCNNFLCACVSCVGAMYKRSDEERFDYMQAMKLMNEIEAEVSGTVVKWVCEDIGTIEPGDVICIIDPNA
jgi:hypothetical protein